MVNYAPYATQNSAKRLPIVFCLDISPSMGWIIDNNSSPIELLNVAVRNFIEGLKQDLRCRNSAEIAFVAYSSDIVLDSDFQSVSTMRIPSFRTVEEGGSCMSKAVLRSIQKIERRRLELIDMQIGYYAPFLVIVTDGDPDHTDDPASTTRAIDIIRKHCNSHIGAREIIVPFVIGVGDYIDQATLNNYASGFTDGFFSIRGSSQNIGYRFNRVFQMIGNSTKKSIHLNAKGNEIIDSIRKDMNAVLYDTSSR